MSFPALAHARGTSVALSRRTVDRNDAATSLMVQRSFEWANPLW